MTSRSADNRLELLKALPDFNQALHELRAPATQDHYVASAALVRGYLEIISLLGSNPFPPEPATTSEKVQRREYAADYRRALLDSNPYVHRDTKVATLHFCCVRFECTSARLVHFLAESTSNSPELPGGRREWYSASPFGVLTYTEGPVATYVMSGKIGRSVCTPLLSLAAFREDVSRLQKLATAGNTLPEKHISYLWHLALEAIRAVSEQRKIEIHSIGEVKICDYSESDCLIRIGTNDFRAYDVDLSLCKTTWQVHASAMERS